MAQKDTPLQVATRSFTKTSISFAEFFQCAGSLMYKKWDYSALSRLDSLERSHQASEVERQLATILATARIRAVVSIDIAQEFRDDYPEDLDGYDWARCPYFITPFYWWQYSKRRVYWSLSRIDAEARFIAAHATHDYGGAFHPISHIYEGVNLDTKFLNCSCLIDDWQGVGQLVRCFVAIGHSPDVVFTRARTPATLYLTGPTPRARVAA